MTDLLLTNMQLFTSQYIKLMDWSGVDYCDVFISCLDSHSDGTHSLQWIHWWVSDVMLIKPIYILDGLRVSIFSANFHFWLNVNLLDLNVFHWMQKYVLCTVLPFQHIWHTIFNAMHYAYTLILILHAVYDKKKSELDVATVITFICDKIK